MKVLMKICAKCGKKLPQGASCDCWKNRQKERQKIYNNKPNVKEKNKFYHSGLWEKIVEVVKARANGLDELALSQGKIEFGNTVHHIYTVVERPDLKTSVDNLIFLSARNHNLVHREYNRDEVSKKILQAKLIGIVRGGKRIAEKI